MKIIRKIKNLLLQNDPVYSCRLYREKGCAHVDGILCDFLKCVMNKEYLMIEKIKEIERRKNGNRHA